MDNISPAPPVNTDAPGTWTSARGDAPSDVPWFDDPSLDDTTRSAYWTLHGVWVAGVDASNNSDFRHKGVLDDNAYQRYQRTILAAAAEELKRLFSTDLRAPEQDRTPAGSGPRTPLVRSRTQGSA